MAGPSWKPLSPFLPPLSRASLSLTASTLLLTTSCPHPSLFPCPSAQALDTPKGGSFCLAGLRCADGFPVPASLPADAARLPPQSLGKEKEERVWGGGIPELC